MNRAVAQVWGLGTLPVGLEFISRCIVNPALTQTMDRFCQPLGSAPTEGAFIQGLPTWLADLAHVGKPMDCAHIPSELSQAVRTMQAECGQHLSIRGLAQACGMSESQFIRRF